jgi:hypothetical protein
MISLFLPLLVSQDAIKVRLVTDEPEVALQILQERQDGKAVTDDDWNKLFSTEGYKRLKDREIGMAKMFPGRDPFTDEAFKTFMLSDDPLKQRKDYQDALDKWKKVDIAECAQRSLSYLPTGSKISATVCYLVKPRHNSFVWGSDGPDPAIMLYLDPSQPAEDLSMTIAHEFHHIGYASTCPSKEYNAWYDKQPKNVQAAQTWLRGFGEGFAVLASGGSDPDGPYHYAAKDVKDSWKSGLAHNAEDMKTLQAFFEDVLNEKLTGDKVTAKASEFYGVVGPWYTTGWVMATTIERAFGRKKLLECYQDPRLIMPTYNEAARKLGGLPLWPEDFVRRMSKSD